MSKHFKRDEQPYIPPSFHDQEDAPARYGDEMPRRWSSATTPIVDEWKHRAKSNELRTLIAACIRKNLFVREIDDDHFSISIRDKKTIPRTYFIENGTYDECIDFLDQYDPQADGEGGDFPPSVARRP